MADNIGEMTMELRVTAPSIMVAEEKLVSLLRPAGLVPNRMRCDGKQLTAEGEFVFLFNGRVKPIAAG